MTSSQQKKNAVITGFWDSPPGDNLWQWKVSFKKNIPVHVAHATNVWLHGYSLYSGEQTNERCP